MQRNTKLAVGLLALTGFVLFSPAHAATKSLTCGGAKTITSEAAKLSPGDVLEVSGACTESVSIPAHVNSISLRGVGGATLATPGGTGAAFSVRGRAITITGFTIRSAGEGVQVIDGGFAWIHGNTIENVTGIGINIGPNSTARIWSNIIRNNGDFGINISRSSSATIGVVSLNDTTASPNEITGNAGGGIHVSGSSYATILGNVIAGNGSRGVLLTRGSGAEIASNTISNNAGSGIEAVHNPTVRLGNPTGTDLRSMPNSGTGNTQYGVQCNGGGHIGGRLGGLSGNAGATDIVACSGGL